MLAVNGKDVYGGFNTENGTKLLRATTSCKMDIFYHIQNWMVFELLR